MSKYLLDMPPFYIYDYELYSYEKIYYNTFMRICFHIAVVG